MWYLKMWYLKCDILKCDILKCDILKYVSSVFFRLLSMASDYFKWLDGKIMIENIFIALNSNCQCDYICITIWR